MIKTVQKILFVLTVFVTTTYAVLPSWTDHTKLYWFEEWQGTFERGSDIRPDAALTGVDTITNEQFNRETVTWEDRSGEDIYLNTTDGTWNPIGSTYEYNITGDFNEEMEVYDGYIRLDNVVDVANQTVPFSKCFTELAVTFSNDAKLYEISWKNKEIYQLDWSPQRWPEQTPYSTLNEFMEAGQPFLHNETSGENAGFRIDANLSDESGDIVIIIFDGSIIEGRPIGTWTSRYTLPGQSSNSIELTFTEAGFFDEEKDYGLATVYDGKVWIGRHQAEGTVWETMGEDELIANETAATDYMTAMNTYDFSKMVNCDLIDKKIDALEGPNHYQISYYRNMNFTSEIEIVPNEWIPFFAGTWSVENGVVVTKSVMYDLNKTVTIFDVSMVSPDFVRTTTGRGELISTNGILLQEPMYLPGTVISHHLSVDDVKIKNLI